MKKLILSLLVGLVAFSASAQLTSTTNYSNAIRMKTTLTSNVDSVVVTNAGSGSLYLNLNSHSAKSIEVLIVKASGTLGGTMTLYGSNDNVNWVALTDATSSPTITTYTVTDAGTYAAPQTKVWFLGLNQMKSYRLTYAGTGTMVGRFKAIVHYQ